MTQTPWGYDVTDLPAIAGATDYERITGKECTDQVSQALAAVSAAVRAWCGWHVSPRCECVATCDVEPGATIVSLPGMSVSVSDVKDHGVSVPDYEVARSGVVRTRPLKGGWGSVEVSYEAGTDAPELVQLVCSVADGIAKAPTGVSSETAGSVSVSWDADTSRVDSVLNDRTKGLLAPYRLSRGE